MHPNVDILNNNQTIRFIRDPVRLRVDNFPEGAEDIEEYFLDLAHDSTTKAVLWQKSLSAFWPTMYGRSPRVAVLTKLLAILHVSVQVGVFGHR